jgi:hypothetical protein
MVVMTTATITAATTGAAVTMAPVATGAMVTTRATTIKGVMTKDGIITEERTTTITTTTTAIKQGTTVRTVEKEKIKAKGLRPSLKHPRLRRHRKQEEGEGGQTGSVIFLDGGGSSHDGLEAQRMFELGRCIVYSL